ncbi:MAG: ABC transporter substrate-binding protein [bacterium]|nr:ABC transporter substrate-binding protein [bacterium]
MISVLIGIILLASACGNGDEAEPALSGPSAESGTPTTTAGGPTDDGDAASAEPPAPDKPAGDPADEAAALEETSAAETAGTQSEVAAEDRPGGELILAVEQWPECLNPVTSCANSTWMIWSVATHLLPSLMELDPDNAYRPSPTLLEEPTLENGGLAVGDDGTFTLTYRLNPEAVWSDGTPFTSTDVWFTWRARLDTDGTLSTIGYELISDIDTSDPHAAVVTFPEPYAPWRDLFGFVLPAHALGPDTNIAGQWNDHIPVSGGPWLQQSWSQDQHVLVPNDNYWVPERRPLVDRVVMVPREDTDSEVVALQTGEVMAAFPQPFPGAVQRLTGDLTFVGGGGTYLEGLWINQNAPDRRFEVTKNVRQAVAYALDRQLIAEVALGSIIEDPLVLQCAGWNPTVGEWCKDDFTHYSQNLEKVTELLSGEGWSRPDPSGLWVNADGTELVLQWNTVAGNKRREDVQALVSEMTAPFGIGWEIINYDAGELFQNRLPVMNFGPVALYASGTSPDPSVQTIYDIEGIPTEANGFTGQNFTAYASQEASDLAADIDRQVDAEARLALVHELGAILAEDVPWIPLYLLPNLLVWNSSLVEGPGAYTFSVYGGFKDIYDWRVIG